MTERRGFNPKDTHRDKSVDKKVGGLKLLPGQAANIEQTRRIQTARDLREIFVNGTDKTTDLGVKLMLDGQQGLITKYLKKEILIFEHIMRIVNIIINIYIFRVIL